MVLPVFYKGACIHALAFSSSERSYLGLIFPLRASAEQADFKVPVSIALDLTL